MRTVDMTSPPWGLVLFHRMDDLVVALCCRENSTSSAGGFQSKDFATPNDESLLWRLYRVQANLAENLPLYLGVPFR